MAQRNRVAGRSCEVVENDEVCGLAAKGATNSGEPLCGKHQRRYARWGDPLVVKTRGSKAAPKPPARPPRAPFVMPTSEQIAWAAALFEGVGCFSTAGQRNKPSATLAMTDFDVVERFAAIVQVGNLTGPNDRPAPRKPILSWQAGSHEEVQFLVCLLWKWLGTRRRERAHELLQAFNGRAPRMVQGSTERWVHETPAYQMFGKRLRDLGPEERRAFDRAKSQAQRDRQRALDGRETTEDYYRNTLAFRLFGKRSRDLTPVEMTEYRRVQAAENRAKRKGQDDDS